MKKGFTLIELLVVIAIIGILSSVVLASLNSAREKARDARRVSDVGQLSLALEMYYNDHTAYPLTAETLSPLVTESFLPVLPVDPSDSGAYSYTSDGTTYCLGIDLENTNSVPDNSNTACETSLTVNYAVAP
ncbi:hypothetical protein A2996_02945 [Candidatus Campbellbacteria bacterium RIFCSPLOWO2_01_FULL_34_15]|uniref:Type II secretion system protein GspG C-terminal domain-containing protein n=2 Tax=Candidatus Campbelliibacteriota TaxID=1752727 RepID=A0A1F5EMQ8_9BACT|nr:MAG: hypothetical protein A2811_01775 [Candidatus Campbellbacteria bacterium RIFCSPHIGHO2_01_FULL_34_10]OGD68682.1 MAG: hypothetical protein A2996_02945 [Candidatus Campbellbacteria bacterium RIFCSPLOWO2_01_FULL_34_15]